MPLFGNSSNTDNQATGTSAQPGGSPRPGKFKDIYDFAKSDTDNEDATHSIREQGLSEPKYQAISSRKLSVSQIIHIKDHNEESRVHDRIMLVIRQNLGNGTSFTCLTFCSHAHDDVLHSAHCVDHARLTTENEHESLAGSEDGYFRLCVSLSWGGKTWRPRENAYINLHELWHIESVENVRFAILGQAHDKYWPSARNRIIDVFVRTMDPDSRRSSTSSSLLPPEVVATADDTEVSGKGKARSTRVDQSHPQPSRKKGGKNGDAGLQNGEEDEQGFTRTTTTTRRGWFSGERTTVRVEGPKGTKSKSYEGTGRRRKSSKDND